MTRAVTALLLCLVLCACGRDGSTTTSDQFPALGSLVEIKVIDAPAGAIDPVLRAVRRGFSTADREWHAWGEGELGRLNAALAAGAAELPVPSPELGRLLQRAAALEIASAGHFNPMVGWLVETWGFHRAERDAAPPPDAARLAAWLALDASLHGWLDGRSMEPRLLRIDLGAFAKGVAVEQAVATLRAQGIEHALVNAGGDIMVIGRAGARPWRIGIRDPRGPGVFAGISLDDGEAIFTSGDYERGFEFEGIRYHHLIDPRTGTPARGTRSMTVVHDDAGLADAASTALFVAGDHWAEVARGMGVDQAMRVALDGSVEILPALAERVRFETPPVELKVVDAQTR